jgi:ADP-heptose:LPS heptosyltransferase
MKILIIQQKRIGDVLTSTILCNNLKKKYPKATIDFMCYPNCADVLQGNPNINSIIMLSNPIRKSYYSLFKFIFEIRAAKYDILVDVYGKLETNLITLFSGGAIKIAYYKWYSSLIYNYNIRRIENTVFTKFGYAIDNRLLLLKPLNITGNTVDPKPKLFVTQEENREAIELLARHNVRQDQKTIMISLLGSEKSKTYPIEYMVKVIEQTASQRNLAILFNYFPNQIEEAKKIYNLCSKSTKEKIHFDILGKNVRSFIAIMNQCDAIIGNDGGAVNMAKALNKPCFIIFSAHVEKNDWATFEDGLQNISVHLNDFKPELLTMLSNKQIKTNALSLYHSLAPELFRDQLSLFLACHLQKTHD